MSTVMVVDLIYKSSLVIVLWATALALGMRIERQELIAPLRNLPQLFTLLALNSIGIPLLVVLGIKAGIVMPEAATGLFLLAITAGGAFALKAAEMGNGDTALALVLVVLLEVLNVVLIPLWTNWFLAAELAIQPLDTLASLVLYILLPLCVGIGIGGRLRTSRQFWADRVRGVSNLFLMVLIVSALLRYWDTMTSILISLVPLCLLTFWLVSTSLGYVFGGETLQARHTGAFVTATRGSALAMVLAANLADTMPSVIAVAVTYGILSLVATTGQSVVWGMRHKQVTSELLNNQAQVT